LQVTMVEQGEALVARWRAAHGADKLPVGVCLFEADWHPGVVGLVASRLKETLHRPVVACAPAGDDSDELRASARSIAGFHIRDALAEVDARHPGLILRFGGHAMAAGLSLRAQNLHEFAAAFDVVASERLAPEQLEAVLLSDGELAAADCTLALAQQLRYAGPWGQSFPEPLFDGEFTVESWRVVGETHLRLKLRPVSGTVAIDGILFGGYRGTPPPARLRAAYQLDINDWRGESTLQLLLRHIEAV
jgi:single-stranded-DNA-specific exonuclease